ncbi:MAG: hypothetical protein AB1611_18490 [bacterium]
MMPYKRQVIPATRGLIFALSVMLVLVLSVAVAGSREVPEMSVTLKAASGWKLTEARVICSGQTTSVGDGAMTGGYIVEATASPVGNCAPAGRGRFQMTLTSFLPSQSIPGQRTGYWQVRGIWSIMSAKAVKNTAGVRCIPTIARGILFAELPFNPATSQGRINAPLTLVMTPDAGRRFARGKGVFSGNEKFEGTIFLEP